MNYFSCITFLLSFTILRYHSLSLMLFFCPSSDFIMCVYCRIFSRGLRGVLDLRVRSLIKAAKQCWTSPLTPRKVTVVLKSTHWWWVLSIPQQFNVNAIKAVFPVPSRGHNLYDYQIAYQFPQTWILTKNICSLGQIRYCTMKLCELRVVMAMAFDETSQDS